MPFRKKTYICPYCFKEQQIEDVEFRCTNKRCAEEDDIPLTLYEGGDSRYPKKNLHVIKPGPHKGVMNSCECDLCHNVSHAVICPNCHNKLPESTLLGEDMIISVVGTRAAGKSHFVTVLINELMKRVAPKFDGSVTGFDDTIARYKAGPYQHLYVDTQTLSLTKSALVSTDNDAYRPFIFTLKLKKNDLFHSISSITLVFFDTAGEDLNDLETMSTVNKYICKSSGIIFLIDPMQLPEVRTQMDEALVNKVSPVDVSAGSDSDDVMTRVSELIRNSNSKLKRNSKIKIPVAVVFSKLDAISELIPDDCVVKQNSPHCDEKAYDVPDGHNVDQEIRSLLMDWGAGAFASQVDMNYSNYQFFAVSALGEDNNPDDSGKIDRPHPHRIEDPILWILEENDVIKAKKK